MMQINSLETPKNMIHVSNHFEAKTTTCLIWSSPDYDYVFKQMIILPFAKIEMFSFIM